MSPYCLLKRPKQIMWRWPEVFYLFLFSKIKKPLWWQASGVADKHSPSGWCLFKMAATVCWEATLGAGNLLQGLGKMLGFGFFFTVIYTVQTVIWKLSIFTLEKSLPELSHGISKLKLHHQTITSIFKYLDISRFDWVLTFRTVILYILRCLNLPSPRNTILALRSQ